MRHPLRLLSFAVVALIGSTLSFEGAAAQTEHVVDISVDPSTGVITVQPDTVIATRGDRVRFVGEGVDSWTVTFAEASPFANRVITGTAEGGPAARVVPILPNAAYRGYKYDVSVTVGEETWTVDPEIVVGPAGETPRSP